jgi:hypothetical protein
MTEQHTPGPWVFEEGHIQRDSGGIRYWHITDDQDAIACNQFCYANYNPEINLANARLIAAAPELLQCAERLAALDGGRGGRAFPTEEDCAFARAVIAKAKGTDHA